MTLQEKLLDLERQRSEIDNEIKDVIAQIQAQCEHNWKWQQIAGEGRYCTKCGYADLDCDD